MDGHWCLCRKPLREAAGRAFFASSLSAVLDLGIRNHVIGFCRNGAMPSMFQEKMRIVFESRGGRGVGDAGVLGGAVCPGDAAVFVATLRRFEGGGLISRSIVL